jgi:hypothetical protein
MLGRLWQRSNWVNDAVLPLLGALTWAAWGGVLVAALLGFVTDQHANLNAGPALLLLLLGGTVAGRLAGRQARGLWVIVLGGLAAALLAEWWLLFWPAYAPWDPGWLARLAAQVGQLAPGPLLVAISAALAWRHGVVAEWTSHAEMTRAFFLGVLVLGGALFVAAAYYPPALGGLTGMVVLMLFSACAGLSLAAIADAAHSVEGDQPLQLNRYWLVAALGAVSVIFALGLLLTSFVTPQSVLAWAALFNPIAHLLGLALWYGFYGLTYVTFLVLTPLIDWLRSLMGGNNPQLTQPFSPFGNRTPEQAAAAPLPPALDLLLRTLTVAAFVGLIVYLVAWALRRRASTDRSGVRENRDLIWSWDLLKEQLASLLARPVTPPLFTVLAASDDPLTWVRRAYQRVLVLALARGRARQPRQTPQAYLDTATELWPGEARGLTALTAAYTAARYGEVAPGAEAIEAARQMLARLESKDEG